MAIFAENLTNPLKYGAEFRNGMNLLVLLILTLIVLIFVYCWVLALHTDGILRRPKKFTTIMSIAVGSLAVTLVIGVGVCVILMFTRHPVFYDAESERKSVSIGIPSIVLGSVELLASIVLLFYTSLAFYVVKQSKTDRGAAATRSIVAMFCVVAIAVLLFVVKLAFIILRSKISSNFVSLSVYFTYGVLIPDTIVLAQFIAVSCLWFRNQRQLRLKVENDANGHLLERSEIPQRYADY
jgi:hypothetical protein